MINIRKVELKDAKRLLEIYDYYVKNTAITFDYETPRLNEFENKIINITKKYPYLVIEEDGVIKGYAYAYIFKDRKAYDHSCETTIYIDKNNHKNGLGKMLYQRLEEELKKIGIKNLYACIGYPEKEDEYLNYNSRDFHRHLGYETIGEFHKCGYKFNRWYNMIWMEKLIDSHE